MSRPAFFFDVVQNEFVFLDSLEKWQDAFEKNGYEIIQTMGPRAV